MTAPGIPEGLEPQLERLGPTEPGATTGYPAGSAVDLMVDGDRATGRTIEMAGPEAFVHTMGRRLAERDA